MAQLPDLDTLPGRRRLYLPNRLFAGPNSFGPLDAPVPANRWHQFPFPPFFPPPFPPLPEDLRCKDLTRAQISTIGGQTATASQIMTLPNHQRIHRIRRCDRLWENLIAYSDPNSLGVPPPPDYNHHLHTFRNPAQNPGRLHLPSAKRQADAIDGLAGWFLAHNWRKPAAITSEPSVQDEVFVQIIEPLNGLLKSRYSPTNPGALPPPDANDPIYPQWGRGSPQAHLNPGNNNNAGYPDYLLYIGPERLRHACVFEIKTWWAYENSAFETIFSNVTAQSGTGIFNWMNAAKPSVLLRQLWGELFMFDSRWGVCTNGQLIFIFVAIAGKNKVNELTLSAMHNFNESTVHQALVGMCFASIDEKFGGIPTHIMDAYLCHNRHSAW